MPNVNALDQAASSYLRSARHQPVHWQQWGADAFAQAQRENKPVLLDVGAVWCHWCHVMDRESYDDPELAGIINRHYIAVKVDRDERPDIDSRYQAAVQAVSGQGGWPLTAFLTPDGKPFFGGTYFPPEERYGRPSFRRVLTSLADAFTERPDEVSESAASIMAAIESNETFSGKAADLTVALSDRLIEGILGQFDETQGGFGSQPKFPHAGALDLLIDRAGRGRGPDAMRARHAVAFTLRKMAAGGIYDQLGGGFHRYSIDERWRVPHFEKMAYDNSELLRCYLHAFQSFVDPRFASIARDILQWMDESLTDRVRGGFYSSQDADAAPGDDGSYYTWSLAEARAVLSEEEAAVAIHRFGISDVGDMQHDPERNVLHLERATEVIAGKLRCDPVAIQSTLERAEARLKAARQARPTPFIDRTLYTGWNAMCISAYLLASRVLNDAEAGKFALRSLERVLDEAAAGGVLNHVVRYGEGAGSSAEPIAAGLEDYAFLATACLDAWETTGELHWYTEGKRLADAMLTRFYDGEGCGFFDTSRNDTSRNPGEPDALGALTARRKPLQDAPTPAGNSVAAALLLRLEALAADDDAQYGLKAQATLELFAGVVEHFGLYAASYGLALVRAVYPPVQVCVVGDDALARDLEATALARYAVNKSVIRLLPEQLSALPPALAATLGQLPAPSSSFALVCRGASCLPPVTDADALIDALIGSLTDPSIDPSKKVRTDARLG